ncbi:helix-turn-helix domain-containing protein [Streptomyces sp. NPDC101175]|uniref:helix-turn-helix domain-containing protein n=1 Tax=Streptomyces sp. NPDC101175 TaxID=3366123 RepID=UPI003832ABA6
MEEFVTVEQAAAYRGVTSRTIRNWTRQGRLTQHPGKRGYMISRDELEKITSTDALAILKDHGDQEKLAAKVRDLLFPVERHEVRAKDTSITFEVRRSTSGELAARQLRDFRNVSLVADAVTVFGRPTLEASCIPPGVGCRWHVADMIALVDGGPMPVDLPAWRTLLGQPCVGCSLKLHPRNPKRSAAASRAVTASGDRVDRGIRSWLEKARQAVARGDFEAARVARKNADAWAKYGATGRGW